MEPYRCPSCKSNVVRESTKRKSIDGYLRCVSCRRLYPLINGIPVFKAGLYLAPVVRVRRLSLAEMEEKVKEAQRKHYKELVRQHREGWKKYSPKGIIESKLLAAMAKSIDKKGKSHLDWATGRGGLLFYLLENTNIPHFFTLDLDIQECAALQRYLGETHNAHRVTVVCGDTRNMPFRDEAFDSASTLWGLDEQREPEKAVLESLRVVKSAGSIVLSGGVEGEALGEQMEERISLFRRILPPDPHLQSVRYSFLAGTGKIPVASYLISLRKDPGSF